MKDEGRGMMDEKKKTNSNRPCSPRPLMPCVADWCERGGRAGLCRSVSLELGKMRSIEVD